MSKSSHRFFVFLAFVILGFAVTAEVSARVLIVAGPAAAGPAGWLAGEQIRHWPVRSDVEILDHQPSNVGSDVSLIIELAEDFDFRGEMPMANGATLRTRAAKKDQEKVLGLSQRAAAAINTTIDRSSERFVVESSTVSDSQVPKITITTSTKTEIDRQRIAKRTRQLRVAVHAILAAENAIDPKVVTPQWIAAPAKAGVLRVAFYDDLGARNRTAACHPAWVRETMRDLHDLDVYLVSAEDIQAGALSDQFDVVIMGGGSSKLQARTLEESGRQAVTQFVNKGGGYVGICAGAFLAARNSFGLGIVPLRSKPSGGGGLSSLHLSDDARSWANIAKSDVDAAFHGGPILSIEDDSSSFDTHIWATFSDDVTPDKAASREVDEDQTPRAGSAKAIPLKNTPAIASSKFGKGRVVIFSPHCERAPGPQVLFWTAVRWSGGLSSEQLKAFSENDRGVTGAIATDAAGQSSLQE